MNTPRGCLEMGGELLTAPETRGKCFRRVVQGALMLLHGGIVLPKLPLVPLITSGNFHI